MNAVNTLHRDKPVSLLEIAQARANLWVEEAAPTIRHYLAIAAMLDEFEAATNFFEGAPSRAEALANDAHSALDRHHGKLRRLIGEFREEAIDRACGFGAGIDMVETVAADTIGLNDAIRSVKQGA
jgi:hypothetical protein